jgi:acyl-coenzyme A synthetase/AMP-(fatty) acid ligase
MTVPSSTDRASLWELTASSGPLSRRFVLDEATRVPLAALAGGTTLGGRRDELRDTTVMLRLSTQLATALALLELDGVARRIVLCTPDLSAEHFPSAVATAAATAVVCDRPLPELAGTGLIRVASSAPAVTPSDAAQGGRSDTEWALFTSGTTGPPKLALHSLRALTGAMARGATPAGDRVWSTFYDIRRYGGLQILLRALVGGGSMVLSGAHEAAGDFLARAGAAGVTFVSGTPTHWRRALLSPAASAIAPPDVRLSGEVADQAILDKLRAAYPDARVCHAFASTEAGVAFDVGDGLAGFPAAWVGETRAGVEVRVADGTLRIRSPRTATRYLGEVAEPLMAGDGFVDTKDLVELRGERYHFVGRRDGVINVGGLKVHPEEVEAVVNRHPSVEMSLVKSKRSPIIGAVVVVDVVLAAGAGEAAGTGQGARALEAEILDRCRQALAPHKVPAAVRVVPSLNVSAAGKLIRSNA